MAERKNYEKKKSKSENLLPIGVMIQSNRRNSFKVTNRIGDFGNIYRVKEDLTKVEYIMKLEGRRTKENRLKAELIVLKAIESAAEENPQRIGHFIRLIDRGMSERHRFIVLNYGGHNLEDLRHRFLKRDFSFSTALRLSIQMIEAIGDLHSIGYFHRNLKPSKFVAGRFQDRNLIYLIGFGVSIRNDANISASKFIGSLRYGSRNRHLGGVAASKDDYESWLFMVIFPFVGRKLQSIEIFEFGSLPWSRLSDRDQIFQYKRNFFRHQYPECYALCPSKFIEIVDILDKPKEMDLVENFLQILHTIRVRNRIDMFGIYDWEKIDLNLSEADGSDVEIILPKRSTEMTNPVLAMGSRKVTTTAHDSAIDESSRPDGTPNSARDDRKGDTPGRIALPDSEK